MAIALRPLRQTRGAGLYTTTGTLELVDFEIGDSVVVEVDHHLLRTSEDSSLYARFADSPLVTTIAISGFRVEPVCDGTDGDQFRLLITYIGAETIISGYPEQDIYVYPEGEEEDYFYEIGTGSATLTWARVGVLSDNA